MFAETTVEAKRKVRSRRNAKVSQQDRKQEQQEAAYAQGYYVEGGAQLDSEPLQAQLKIPPLHLKTASAHYCQLPDELRASTLTFMDTAEVLLTDAAVAYDKAISMAGFTTDGHMMFNASKAFLPITFSLLGPMLDTKHLKSGAQQMLAQWSVSDRIHGVVCCCISSLVPLFSTKELQRVTAVPGCMGIPVFADAKEQYQKL